MIPAPFRPYIYGALAVVLLAGSLWVWRIDSLRASYKRQLAEVRQEYTLFKTKIIDRTAEALAAQKAVNAAQEQEWKDKADAADESIVDLRARLRASLVRQGSGGGAGRKTGSPAKADGAGVPQEVPAAPPGDSGSVQVGADVLAGLAAYAIQAHEWAVSLDPSDLEPKPVSNSLKGDK
ncbi:hypothetical protein [Sphingobium olei]|uniref:Uncharacterized protein n=1 Tax=Sphingobium olei TaxID=420955 RepID=A0ABW3NZB9_9SPHN